MSRRPNVQIIADLRERKARTQFYNQMFNHDLPPEHRKAAEKFTKRQFDIWWDSWVEPLIAECEQRMVKPRKGGAS